MARLHQQADQCHQRFLVNSTSAASTQLAFSPAVMRIAAHENQEEQEFLILASGAVAAVAAGVATVAASVVAIL